VQVVLADGFLMLPPLYPVPGAVALSLSGHLDLSNEISFMTLAAICQCSVIHAAEVEVAAAHACYANMHAAHQFAVDYFRSLCDHHTSTWCYSANIWGLPELRTPSPALSPTLDITISDQKGKGKWVVSVMDDGSDHTSGVIGEQSFSGDMML